MTGRARGDSEHVARCPTCGHITAWVPMPEHGTLARYLHHREPCSCKLCRGAQAKYQRERRARTGRR